MSANKPRAVYIGATSAAAIEAATEAEAGWLVKAIIAWALHDETPTDIPPALVLVWRMVERESIMIHELRTERANAGRLGGKQTQANASKVKQAEANTSKDAEVKQNPDRIEGNRREENTPANAGDARAREVSSEWNQAQEDAFGHFWSAYPRKAYKPKAMSAWLDTFGSEPPKPETLSAILSAIKAARASDAWREDNGRFVPNPDKWIRGRGWENATDALPPPAPRRRANETNLTAIHSGNPQYANLPV